MNAAMNGKVMVGGQVYDMAYLAGPDAGGALPQQVLGFAYQNGLRCVCCCKSEGVALTVRAFTSVNGEKLYRLCLKSGRAKMHDPSCQFLVNRKGGGGVKRINAKERKAIVAFAVDVLCFANTCSASKRVTVREVAMEYVMSLSAAKVSAILNYLEGEHREVFNSENPHVRGQRAA